MSDRKLPRRFMREFDIVIGWYWTVFAALAIFATSLDSALARLAVLLPIGAKLGSLYSEKNAWRRWQNGNDD